LHLDIRIVVQPIDWGVIAESCPQCCNLSLLLYPPHGSPFLVSQASRE